MWRRKLLCIIGLVLLVPPRLAWSQAVTITVRAESVVRGRQITIGDVAEVRGGDERLIAQIRGIVVGQSPATGETRVLHGGYVATRLKQHGLAPPLWSLKVPPKFRVRRASQRLEARDLEAAVKRAIEQHMPWSPQRAMIRQIRGIAAVVLPPGRIRYEVTFPGQPDFIGPTSFALRVRVDEEVAKRLHGTAYIEVVHDIVTLVRPLARHEVITEADIRLQQVRLSRAVRQTIRQVKDVIGKRTRRALRANAMLHTYEVEAQPLVHRGDVVLIVVESAWLKITTMGEALEHGERGATIRVRNASSKREVRAVVVDSKTVRIPF